MIFFSDFFQELLEPVLFLHQPSLCDKIASLIMIVPLVAFDWVLHISDLFFNFTIQMILQVFLPINRILNKAHSLVHSPIDDVLYPWLDILHIVYHKLLNVLQYSICGTRLGKFQIHFRNTGLLLLLLLCQGSDSRRQSKILEERLDAGATLEFGLEGFRCICSELIKYLVVFRFNLVFYFWVFRLYLFMYFGVFSFHPFL